MKTPIQTYIILFLTIFAIACNLPNKSAFKQKIVYQSKDLIITQLTENSFQHTSYLQTNDFGNVPCNGLIVSDNNEAVVFDTPTTNKTAEELINFIKQTLKFKINAVAPTHFHNDCLAGLAAFHSKKIPSYAYLKTVALAKADTLIAPQNSFTDSLILNVGSTNTIIKFFGEGHTKDNVVAYFPKDKVMFGGCLVKELNATKGFLGDANVASWSNTVQKVKKAYPAVQIIVPGHGKNGNQALLDYTIKLFKD
ncbi:MAG: subclass B1 metallo-beta-lactamase [Bacteroidota bacterium]